MSLSDIVDWILHLDRHLNELIESVGAFWVYLVVFAIVFCETGLVVFPFLPGDSLLFALGALAANSDLSLTVLLPILIFAAITGDALNYWIGAYVGPKVFKHESSWWLNKDHLERAQKFYEKYGAKAIVLARFVPIVRTFAPFVAGIGRMNFVKFWFYNILGGTIWVVAFLVAGYWFGNWKIVKENFSLVTLGIILVSILPIAYEFWAHHREKKKSGSKEDSATPHDPST
jgi:membrane-associated protein